MRIVLIVWSMFFALVSLAQEKASVFGRVTDEKGKGLELVNVAIAGLPGGTTTDSKGRYELQIPANRSIYLAVSSMGYEKSVQELTLAPGEKRELNFRLHLTAMVLPQVQIEDNQVRTSNLIRLDPKVAVNIPTASERIPTLLKTLPGVSSGNELSSQYSVRGGNFDENLVYVNDIEIYRPFLIRSGQQEGLSFVNSDLVSSLLFSAGGFDAKYGDKMSSVLDLQYKKPTEFGGSVSGSLLGGSVHAEGALNNRKFTYLMGARYKSNSYILNALETTGDYKPTFTDIQALFTYQATKKIEFSFLGNIADNKYKLVPETRETNFGTVNQAKRLTIYFDGQEVDSYSTWLGGFTTSYRPDKQTRLKIIASAYQSNESETYDVIGQYWIGDIENNLASENFGNVIEAQDIGTQMIHARNKLNVGVFNVAHKGTREWNNNLLQWGAKYQHENIDDRMNEWVLIDSAGYSLPRPHDSIGYSDPSVQPDNPFNIYELLQTQANILSNRYTAYVQNTWGINPDSSRFVLTAGVRAHYWDFNKQLVVSPRATLSFKPHWEHDILFRFSAGMYYQPPFYRELKNIDGRINNNLKAQSSLHFVAAGDYNFKIWDRPFKFVSEVYYKYMGNLTPYLIDNVRIRYYSFEKSRGYAAGIDFKVNGEFVPGVESWASLSIMQTMEDVAGDGYVNKRGTGYIPRPTDQRVNFSIFFQDYLPMNPTYKMSMTLLFGSSLPFGPPHSPKYTHTLRMPPYRRVDIGFSKEIVGEHTRFTASNPFRFLKSLWLTAEVLNLLQVNNTVSYIWVTDILGRQYAVPNYLTPRQLNVKLVARF